MSELYPWPGDFEEGDPSSSIAVVTLSDKFELNQEKVAIWGPMKTENLGIEKVIANVLSNPNIRFILICGKEIRGHRSGNSLLELIENGVEENGKIVDAPGAVPYIENIDHDGIERFREQVEGIDMIGEQDLEKIEEKIDRLDEKDPEPFGEPYTVVKIKKKEKSSIEADLALHSKLSVSPWGKIEPLEV